MRPKRRYWPAKSPLVRTPQRYVTTKACRFGRDGSRAANERSRSGGHIAPVSSRARSRLSNIRFYAANPGDFETLLFHSQKLAAGGVNGDPQLGFILTAAVNHVPYQFVLLSVPIENEEYRLLGISCGQLFAAVLLRSVVCFVAVNLEKAEIEDRGRAIVRIPGVLGRKADTLLGGIGPN